MEHFFFFTFKTDFIQYCCSRRGFPGGLVVKYPPAMQDTCVWSLGQEDPLEKEMATPLQYSCLRNPMGRGTWWATVNGVVVGQDWGTEHSTLQEERQPSGDSFVEGQAKLHGGRMSKA